MAEGRKWKNPVNTQMGSKPPSMTPSQSIGTIKAPFNKPHDSGNGGIPLKMMEQVGSGGAGTKTQTPGEVGGLAKVPASGPSRSPARARVPTNKGK